MVDKVSSSQKISLEKNQSIFATPVRDSPTEKMLRQIDRSAASILSNYSEWQLVLAQLRLELVSHLQVCVCVCACVRVCVCVLQRWVLKMTCFETCHTV